MVLDGEMVVEVDGIQEFDMLSQRIHPAESRVKMLAEQTPARYVAFDVLAVGDEVLMELGYDERRARLAKLKLGTGRGVAVPDHRRGGGPVAAGRLRGRRGQGGRRRYLPGERKGMVKIKRVRTADVVVVAYRYGKEEGTVGSLILGPVRRRRRAARGRPHLELQGQGEARAAGLPRPLPHRRARLRRPGRWKSDEELMWEGLRPELVCEINFDHITGDRIRHGTKFLRWREDKAPEECTMEQLRG